MKAEHSDYVPSNSSFWRSVAVIGALVVLMFSLLGCDARDREEAVAAANIWHAAEAITLGVPAEKPVAAIQAAADAIALSNGYAIEKGATDE